MEKDFKLLDIGKSMRFICSVCNYVYDESKGDASQGIEAETLFNNLPKSWVCPICKVGKDKFYLEKAKQKAILTKIVAIRDETHDVRTFRFATDETFSYVSGQHGLFSFGEGQRKELGKRPFTFSSSPLEKGFEITVKECGIFTKELFKLTIGDALLMEGPIGGALIFDEHIAEDIVFISGGSGITPFISSLRYAVRKKVGNSFTLLFGNNTCEDVIFQKELEAMNKRYDKISVIFFVACTNRPPEFEEGFITKEKILHYVENPLEKRWYLCGPPAMNKAIISIFDELGIPEEKRCIDKWEIPVKKDCPC